LVPTTFKVGKKNPKTIQGLSKGLKDRRTKDCSVYLCPDRNDLAGGGGGNGPAPKSKTKTTTTDTAVAAAATTTATTTSSTRGTAGRPPPKKRAITVPRRLKGVQSTLRPWEDQEVEDEDEDFLEKIQKDMDADTDAVKEEEEEEEELYKEDEDLYKDLYEEHDGQTHQSHRQLRIGTLRNLVIPIRFRDHTSRPLPTLAQLDVLMNARTPDAQLAPTGSVWYAFYENSYGKLNLESIVVDWVTSAYSERDIANGNSG
jgi:hypothetical protein